MFHILERMILRTIRKIENIKILQNIQTQLDSLRKEMNNMIVTDESGISDKLIPNSNKIKARKISSGDH